MNHIQQIFRLYGDEYIRRYGSKMPQQHKKVIQAILNCRSGKYGYHLYQCPECGSRHVSSCSCGNRHCPGCQQHKAKKWLFKQMRKLLPCPYFLVTFTVPEELRLLIRGHQKWAYSVMFNAGSAALKKLLKDKRFAGADQSGFFGVLHTWGRILQYHPHIHFVVPGGGLSKDRSKWMASKPNFLVHVKALSIIYKAKFRDAVRQAGLLDRIDSGVWRRNWVVNSQAVGSGKWTLRYLSRYVFRVAISNSRIISYDNHQVTFKYRKVKNSRSRRMSLDAMEFIRRFLQHVLPTGFMKIRHYGFLSPNAATSIQKIRELICVLYELAKKFAAPLKLPKPPKLECPNCGSALVWQMFIRPARILSG